MSCKNGPVEYDEFDWLVEYSVFRNLLKPEIDKLKVGIGRRKALVLGCGTSGLSEAILRDGLVHDVLSIDCEQSCIDIMKAKTQSEAALRWAKADINDVASMDSVIKQERFDLIVDKGTLDAMICQDASGYMVSVGKFLRCGGILALVTLHNSKLMEPLLTFDFGRRFSLNQVSFKDPFKGAEEVNHLLVTLTCGEEYHEPCNCTHSILSKDAIAKHFQAVLDWYHQDESPFLSTDRELRLRKDYHEINKAPRAKGITSKQAYGLVFTPIEQDVYLFEDFIQDMAACNPPMQQPHSLEDIFAFINQKQ